MGAQPGTRNRLQNYMREPLAAGLMSFTGVRSTRPYGETESWNPEVTWLEAPLSIMYRL